MRINLTKSGYVISDLHLFTRRTAAKKQKRRMYQAAEKADFFVFNGDIFDFPWTTLDSMDETAVAAIDWLTQFLDRFPNCEFYYVMGNHDAREFFVPYLNRLARRKHNFHWHPSHVHIGSSLFLHGDLALNVRCEDPFARTLQSADSIKHRSLHWSYNVLVATRLHWAMSWAYSPRWCARRIFKALLDFHPHMAEDIRHIYFGHIHRSFENFRYRGITFHNTGSSVRGLRCRLLSVRT